MKSLKIHTEQYGKLHFFPSNPNRVYLGLFYMTINRLIKLSIKSQTLSSLEGSWYSFPLYLLSLTSEGFHCCVADRWLTRNVLARVFSLGGTGWLGVSRYGGYLSKHRLLTQHKSYDITKSISLKFLTITTNAYPLIARRILTSWTYVMSAKESC